jgi:hypothetical protein
MQERDLRRTRHRNHQIRQLSLCRTPLASHAGQQEHRNPENKVANIHPSRPNKKGHQLFADSPITTH